MMKDDWDTSMGSVNDDLGISGNQRRVETATVLNTAALMASGV